MLNNSSFVDGVMFLRHGAIGPESSTTLYFEEVRQVAVPVGRETITVLSRVHQNVERRRSLLYTIALFDLLWIRSGSVVGNIQRVEQDHKKIEPWSLSIRLLEYNNRVLITYIVVYHLLHLEMQHTKTL